MNDTNIVGTAIELASITKERKTKKKINQASCFFDKMNELYYEDGKGVCFKIKRGFKAGYLTIRGLTCALETFSLNEKELNQRKKMAQNLFGYSEDEVAREHTELVNPSSATKMYVDDIRYNAAIPLRRFSELEVIWGDAELLALHDFEYIHSLKAIIGDLYISEGKNENALKNLQVITGNFYPGNVDLSTFENLVYVGGNIYQNGKETALKENKKKSNQLVKK